MTDYNSWYQQCFHSSSATLDSRAACPTMTKRSLTLGRVEYEVLIMDGSGVPLLPLSCVLVLQAGNIAPYSAVGVDARVLDSRVTKNTETSVTEKISSTISKTTASTGNGITGWISLGESFSEYDQAVTLVQVPVIR